MRQPRKRAIEEWDKQCIQLNEELAKSRTILEKEIADAQQQLRSHLFVSARLAPELEQAMQLQLRELGSLEIELKRIKSTYKGS